MMLLILGIVIAVSVLGVAHFVSRAEEDPEDRE